MKKFLILLALTISSSSLFAQCDKIFDFREGTSWTWYNYDKKGKLIGKTIQKVDKYEINGDSRKASLSIVNADKKGDQTAPVSMEMTCKAGVIYADMKKFVPKEYMEEDNGETSLEISGNNLELPASMKVGDALRDASVAVNISGSSTMAMNFTVQITNRKVESEETLNSPAGQFQCLVISQKVSTKMMVSVEVETKDWYSPGIGAVKSESYRKGKMMGYSILSAFNK